jgi:MATE family multidrug resistance protein
MGRFGTATDLAAVAVGAVVFNLVAWAFGFLRMATTGLTAQAIGADDLPEAKAVLLRALAIGLAAGLAITALLPLLGPALQPGFGVAPDVADEAANYLVARGLGAPAALMGFAINGWLLGRGRTRQLLAFQVVLNGTNAVLDALFVAGLGMGAWGVGLGTAIANVVALGVGLWLVREAFAGAAPLRDGPRLRALFHANRDILVRTLALVGSFAWFVRAGAAHGTEVVAGNEVLLQFIAVSALVLDAFAFLTEKEAGEAVGASDATRLVRVLRRTTVLSLGCGVGFALAIAGLGPSLVRALVADPGAREAALRFLPYCAMVPVLGVPAWQLDGLFLGATRGRALRNAAVVATLAYVLVDRLLTPWGPHAMWWAFLASYGFRAAGLAVATPTLLRDLTRSEGPAPPRCSAHPR